MKITYLGLSSFLIESKTGDSVLIDPYHDEPEFYLGLTFPKHIQANIVLVSHPDEDHSYLRHHLLKQQRPSQEQDTSPDVTILPDINLRGHLVREWNGDINIAYACTIDGMRLLHLADNAHVLSKRQIKEIGPIDILFISPPKYPNDRYIQNIHALHPHIVIPSHYIPVPDGETTLSQNKIAAYYRKKLLQPWVTNPYLNEETIEMLVHIFMGAQKLTHTFPHSKHIFSSSLSLTPKDFLPEPRVFMFHKKLKSL